VNTTYSVDPISCPVLFLFLFIFIFVFDDTIFLFPFSHKPLSHQKQQRAFMSFKPDAGY